ncbi:calcium/calmodulin-dependent protein kinase type II subunit alpha-like isoform X2 [Adelges cooleyi]|nr:calcium/calmodulin-dependent protein kinase type II subunit alpha-like isoform X2 [Adelges cooleyi]
MKEHYELQSEIGRGKFGTVFKCREKATGLMLAAKFVGIVHKQDRRNVEREVEIMCELQHPRLIQLYDAFEANNAMCFILELVEGGELFERVIDDDFVLTEKSVTVFMRQICEGVQFIHSKNILHLDIKPENILCLTKTGNRIKIIDFGLARKFNPEHKLQVLFGTPEFVAPEVVNFDAIGFGTDMWSVGVVCYVLLSGLSPFMGETDVETMANVTIAQYDFDDESFDSISNDAKDFIKKLLVKDHKSRMTATECLSHSWMQKKSTKKIMRKKGPAKKLSRQESIKVEQDCPPSLSVARQDSSLDLTKENLREFCERKSGTNSPTDVVPVTASDRTLAPKTPSPPLSVPEVTQITGTKIVMPGKRDETVANKDGESKFVAIGNVLPDNGGRVDASPKSIDISAPTEDRQKSNVVVVVNNKMIEPTDKVDPTEKVDAKTVVPSENDNMAALGIIPADGGSIKGKSQPAPAKQSSTQTVVTNIVIKSGKEQPGRYDIKTSPLVDIPKKSVDTQHMSWTHSTTTTNRRSSDVSYMFSRTTNTSTTTTKSSASLLHELVLSAADGHEDPHVAAHNLHKMLLTRQPFSVDRKPKFKLTSMNRDVPIGSPPPASNLLYYMTDSYHSAPHSKLSSPDRESAKDMLLRLFYGDRNKPAKPDLST